MLMRVIAGIAKGVVLRSPKGACVRPATDRVKESLFGALGDRVEGARVLDLFAGSGSVGIEALSRGAVHCTFFDNNAMCLRAIRENLAKTRLEKRATVVRGNALKIKKILVVAEGDIDLAFVDPPYALTRQMDVGSPVGQLLLGMCEGAFLRDRALVVVEHSTSSSVPDHLAKLDLYDRRRYGDTTISIFERQSTAV